MSIRLGPRIGPLRFRWDSLVLIAVILFTGMWEGERIRSQIANNGAKSRIVLDGLLNEAVRTEKFNADVMLRLHDIELKQSELREFEEINSAQIKEFFAEQKRGIKK